MNAGAEVRHQKKLGDESILADIEWHDEPRDLEVAAIERLVDGKIHDLLRGHAAFAEVVVRCRRGGTHELRAGIGWDQLVPVDFLDGTGGGRLGRLRRNGRADLGRCDALRYGDADAKQQDGEIRGTKGVASHVIP